MFIKETKQEVSSGTYAFERRRAPPRSDEMRSPPAPPLPSAPLYVGSGAPLWILCV